MKKVIVFLLVLLVFTNLWHAKTIRQLEAINRKCDAQFMAISFEASEALKLAKEMGDVSDRWRANYEACAGRTNTIH